jgi:hypothetical protein
MIMHQGEGTPEDKEDCHFGIFKNIQGDYKYFLKDNPEFRPARDIITNPVVFNKGNYGSDKGILIINEITRLVADLFDDIYHLMLLALQYCFGNTEGDKIFNKKIAGFAIQIMVRVIKPLGELLTKLPAFQDSDLKKAGAAFGLSRHISLPNNNSIAGVVLRERASEILSRFRTIDLQGRPEKDVVIFHLADIIQQL